MSPLKLMILSLILLSCSQSETEEFIHSNDEFYGKLIIEISECTDVSCENKIQRSRDSIKLYYNEMDAKLDLNPLGVYQTDEEGKLKIDFIDLPDGFVFIKANIGHWDYIAIEKIPKNQKAYHYIDYNPVCKLSSNNIKTCNKNIAFNNLLRGQKNRYKLSLISSNGTNGFTITATMDTLYVEVKERVDTNSFIVKEKYKQVSSDHDSSYLNQYFQEKTSKWTYQNNYLKIEGADLLSHTSYLFNPTAFSCWNKDMNLLLGTICNSEAERLNPLYLIYPDGYTEAPCIKNIEVNGINYDELFVEYYQCGIDGYFQNYYYTEEGEIVLVTSCIEGGTSGYILERI